MAALREKRATTASEIFQLERQLRHKHANLVHVDTTLENLDPSTNPETIPIKRIVKHVNLSQQGDLSTPIHDAFRVSEGGAASTRDIAETVIWQQGLEDEARKANTNRVRQNLVYQLAMGLVTKMGEGTPARRMLQRH